MAFNSVIVLFVTRDSLFYLFEPLQFTLHKERPLCLNSKWAECFINWCLEIEVERLFYFGIKLMVLKGEYESILV